MKVRLGDVATYINGYTFKPEDWSTIGKPIIRIQDLTGNSYQTNRFDGVVPSKYLVVTGDVLISWSASLGIYVWNGGDAVLNQHIFKVVFDKADIDKNFFIYQVSEILRKAASDTHGATMKHLTKPIFDSLPFYLPDIHDQERISRLLDKTASLISDRRKQLALLDTLIKARFVEMFGDIERAKYTTISDVCSIITDGTHQPPKFVQEGIPFIFVSNLANDEVTYDTEKFITEETNSELIKRTPIDLGDVLLTTVGSYGHPAVVKSNKKFLFQRHIAYLKPKHEVIDSEYLRAVFLSSDCKCQIEEKVKGIAQKTLNLSEIRSIGIPLPPMKQQNEFAAFVAHIDKSKAVVQKALDETQLLFDSLMQKYFG